MDPLSIAGQTILDKYEIKEAVGEGGFAIVYRARHTIWNKPVAIKFFHALASVPADQRDRLHQAFIDEGALLTDLSSRTASIVQARDVGTFTTPDGRWMPFMVLEWLDGRSLGDIMEDDWAQGRGPWPLPLVVEQLSAVAQALEVAHRSGVAHRDVKPGNIFVLGGQARVPGTVFKLLDFGVAKMMADDTDMKAALAKTGHNLASFTPQYGAPEQFNRKYGATGPWTDVFALATVAVELLSGHMALEGDDVVQLSVSTANPAPTVVPLQPGSQGAERCDWVSLCDGPSPTVAGEPAPGPEVAAR